MPSPPGSSEAGVCLFFVNDLTIQCSISLKHSRSWEFAEQPCQFGAVGGSTPPTPCFVLTEGVYLRLGLVKTADAGCGSCPACFCLLLRLHTPLLRMGQCHPHPTHAPPISQYPLIDVMTHPNSLTPCFMCTPAWRDVLHPLPCWQQQPRYFWNSAYFLAYMAWERAPAPQKGADMAHVVPQTQYRPESMPKNSSEFRAHRWLIAKKCSEGLINHNMWRVTCLLGYFCNQPTPSLLPCLLQAHQRGSPTGVKNMYTETMLP